MLIRNTLISCLFLLSIFSICKSQAVNGGWGNWTDLSECSATCASGTKERERLCNNPSPDAEGKECTKLEGSSGLKETEVIACNSQQCPFVEWKEWTPECNDCDALEQTRVAMCGTEICEEDELYKKGTRICLKWKKDNCTNPCVNETICPADSTCQDKSTELVPDYECKCNTTGFEFDEEKYECYDPNVDINGEWTEWTDDGECSCEPGQQSKKKMRRICTNPKPQANGNKCMTEDKVEGLEEVKEENCTIDCTTQVVNGGWGEWEKDGECNKPCNGGKQKWVRTCSNPAPKNGGLKCLIKSHTELMTDTKELDCNTQFCPFSNWTEWTTCPACTVSTITRDPLCGDIRCPSDVESESNHCNTWVDSIDCPSPCDSSPCPTEASCNDTSTVTAPSYECVCPEGKTLSVRGTRCNSEEDVDGDWTLWATIKDECSTKCELGVLVNVSTCDNPKPRNNGELCVNTDGDEFGASEKWIITIPCPKRTCFDGIWTPWSECPPCTYDGAEQVSHPLCGDYVCPLEDKMAPEKKVKVCDTWRKGKCLSPCDILNGYDCPEKSICEDNSTETRPGYYCKCVLGRKLSKDKKECIIPPPVPPTPRPIPVLPEEQKTVATVISKTASTVLIVMVSITLILFLMLRIFTPDRVIQMNMEISLLLAHVCLMLPPSTTEKDSLCRTISILIHFFFTACYTFMMLEALHMYSLVAFVVKKDGLFSRLQNILIGWGVALIIVLFNICFEYNNYGGQYHCWLQMDTPLFYGQIIPTVIIVIVTITLIEAAGSADYKPLMGVDTKQRTSAKISQRTNLILLPFMTAHWFLGMLSEYEQNLALYSTFSVVNAIFGVLVFFFHCTNNQQVRDKLGSCFKSIRGKKTTASQ